MSDMLLKLVSRLVFVALAIIIIPLAVQNRQMVSVELNPLALVNEAQSTGFSMPLFVLLILTLFIGLASGVVFGWAMASLKARKKQKSEQTRAPIPARSDMLNLPDSADTENKEP